MGNSLSKSIDFEHKLYIIFDIYPIVNYKNACKSNLLEQNNNFKKYISHKIKKSFNKITNIQLVIPNNNFIVIVKLNQENILYYEINMLVEFINVVQEKDNKNIQIPMISSLMSNINIQNIYQDNKIITFELLEKTILNVFMEDIINKKNIKIDKSNYISLNYDSIQNIQIYQNHS
jgi:hypothetical protein